MKTEKEMAEKVSIITRAYKSNENTKYTKQSWLEITKSCYVSFQKLFKDMKRKFYKAYL